MPRRKYLSGRMMSGNQEAAGSATPYQNSDSDAESSVNVFERWAVASVRSRPATLISCQDIEQVQNCLTFDAVNQCVCDRARNRSGTVVSETERDGTGT